MKTSLRIIVLRSWLLPWREKRLLILPIVLFGALLFTETLGGWLGLETVRAVSVSILIPVQPNGTNVSPTQEPTEKTVEYATIPNFYYDQVTRVLLYAFFSGASIAAFIHSLNGIPYDMRRCFIIAWRRLIPLVLLTITISVLVNLPTIFPRLMMMSYSQVMFWELLSLLNRLLVSFVFLLTLPTLINEEGSIFHLLRRSWKLCRAEIRTLLTSLFGLWLTLLLLGAAYLFIETIILPTSIKPQDGSFAGRLFPLRIYFAFIVLPVSWSYQALFYQHARDSEPS